MVTPSEFSDKKLVPQQKGRTRSRSPPKESLERKRARSEMDGAMAETEDAAKCSECSFHDTAPGWEPPSMCSTCLKGLCEDCGKKGLDERDVSTCLWCRDRLEAEVSTFAAPLVAPELFAMGGRPNDSSASWMAQDNARRQQVQVDHESAINLAATETVAATASGAAAAYAPVAPAAAVATTASALPVPLPPPPPPGQHVQELTDRNGADRFEHELTSAMYEGDGSVAYAEADHGARGAGGAWTVSHRNEQSNNSG